MKTKLKLLALLLLVAVAAGCALTDGKSSAVFRPTIHGYIDTSIGGHF
jgi:hypothetical protein